MTYWITSAALVVFGYLGSFSIGQPFLLVGLVMLILGPFRRRALVFWPPLLAVIAYNIAFWATAPLSCVARQAVGGASHTVCTSLIGIRYEGLGVYNPSLTPAVDAGLGVAVVVLVASFVFLLWDRTRRRGPGRSSGT